MNDTKDDGATKVTVNDDSVMECPGDSEGKRMQHYFIWLPPGPESNKKQCQRCGEIKEA